MRSRRPAGSSARSPTPAGDAVVRTTAALICTSDVHTVPGLLPVPEGRLLGHESVGVVHEVGEGVTSVAVGDRVAVNAATPDGTCDNCQAGHTSRCRGALGGYRFTVQKDGNMAEYVHVNDADDNLAPIPEGLADDVAVYACDMLSTGIVGAENANIPVGGTVARGAPDAPARQRQDRPDADDDPPDADRPGRGGVHDDEREARRDRQTADHVPSGAGVHSNVRAKNAPDLPRSRRRCRTPRLPSVAWTDVIPDRVTARAAPRRGVPG